MQLGDLVYYAFLTIAVTATCVTSKESRHRQELETIKTRKLIRRDAALLIDNFPFETTYNLRPKVIYRRVSRQRYGPSKSKYGPPRPKYGPPVKNRKPTKKYRKPQISKYGPPNKQRSPKPRYGPPKRPSNKPIYGVAKKPHTPMPSYYSPEPTGFAEPPMDYDHHPLKHNYGEPPVDSYGAPLKTPNDPYPTAPAYNDGPSPTDHSEYPSFQEYQAWHNYHQESAPDSTYAYSKKRPLFTKPDDVFNEQINPDEDVSHENSYSDIYGHHKYKEPHYMTNRKKPQDSVFADMNKKVNKYWKSPKLRPEKVKSEPGDEILVGGQYAEPPARYVPKFLPSAPMFSGDDDFNPPKGFDDPEVAATSATISPYVNYKNGNIAFSPQNLNDAFSIVDK